ncbi:MAG: hypothetical protein ACK56F_12635, partial [bacterium]
ILPGKDMLLGRLEGGNCVCEIWIKTKNRRFGLLNYTQVFYTSKGGDRRPQSAVWRVGVSWQIVTEPL